jgi:uncharacterized protein YdiU (UPF0061 family)
MDEQIISTLHFKNSFAALGENFSTPVTPSGIANPWLVSVNGDAAELLGIDTADLQQDWFLQWCSGNLTLPGSAPRAMSPVRLLRAPLGRRPRTVIG